MVVKSVASLKNFRRELESVNLQAQSQPAGITDFVGLLLPTGQGQAFPQLHW